MYGETFKHFAVVLVAFSPGAVALASPQYTVIDLGRGILNGAYVGTDGTPRQVGIASTQTAGSQPLIWSGQTANPVDLQPSQYLFGDALGGYISGGTDFQVGEVGNPQNIHAAFWAGSAATFVDLGVGGAVGGYGTPGGGEQVGFDGNNRPILWKGTPASALDLTPTGHTGGFVYGGYWTQQGSRQVGQVDGHAVIWSGTPDSASDINPSGYSGSLARAGALTLSGGDSQVGYALPTGANFNGRHAIYWAGDAGSAIDISPAGAAYSEAKATNGSMIVGFDSLVSTGSFYRAVAWTGPDRLQAIDLHALLPAGEFETSVATGIDANGNIVGYAAFSNGQTDLILWAVPEPTVGGWLGVLALLSLRRQRNA